MINNEICFSLRKKRMEIGMSQRELAEKLGTSQPVVAKIEAGNQNLSMEMLERFTKALGVEFKFKFLLNEK